MTCNATINVLESDGTISSTIPISAPAPLSDSARNVLVAAIEWLDAQDIGRLPSSGDGYAAGRVKDARRKLERALRRLPRDERRALLAAAGRTGGRLPK